MFLFIYSTLTDNYTILYGPLQKIKTAFVSKLTFHLIGRSAKGSEEYFLFGKYFKKTTEYFLKFVFFI